MIEPVVTKSKSWNRIESRAGTWFVPDDIDVEPADVAGSGAEIVETIDGFGAAFQGAGVPKPEWSVFKTRVEAFRYLLDRTPHHDNETRGEIFRMMRRLLRDTPYRVETGTFETEDGAERADIAVVFDDRGNVERAAHLHESGAYLDALERAESIAPKQGGLK